MTIQQQRPPSPSSASALDAHTNTNASTDDGRTVGGARLIVHQVVYEFLAFFRNPQAAVFTFALPIMITLMFGMIFGGGGADSFFDGLSALQYFVPTIAALSLFGSCYAQVAIVLAVRRHTGVLKRLHATPAPAWAYFLGLLATFMCIGLAEVALIVGCGAAFGVPMPQRWPAILFTLVVGAAAFCPLGVAVGSLIRNAEAAPAVVQFIQIPLLFLSGSYFPIHSQVLNDVAAAFPVRAFNEALIGPFSQNSGLRPADLAILAAWGAAGTLVSLRSFPWSPRPE